MKFVQNCFYAIIFLLCAMSASSKSNGIKGSLFCPTSSIYASDAIGNNINALAFKKCRRISTVQFTKYLLLDYMLSNPGVYNEQVSHNFTPFHPVIKNQSARKINRKGFRTNTTNRSKIYFKSAKIQSHSGCEALFTQKSVCYLRLQSGIINPYDSFSFLSVQRI